MTELWWLHVLFHSTEWYKVYLPVSLELGTLQPSALFFSDQAYARDNRRNLLYFVQWSGDNAPARVDEGPRSPSMPPVFQPHNATPLFNSSSCSVPLINRSINQPNRRLVWIQVYQ